MKSLLMQIKDRMGYDDTVTLSRNEFNDMADFIEKTGLSSLSIDINQESLIPLSESK